MFVYNDEDVAITPLPRFGARRVLHEGLHLPHLTELVIDGLSLDAMQELADEAAHRHLLFNTDVCAGSEHESESDNSDGVEDPYQDHWCVDVDVFKTIRKACPNLRRLTLNSVLAIEGQEAIDCEVPRALHKLKVRGCMAGWGLVSVCTRTGWQQTTMFNVQRPRSEGINDF